MALGSYRTPLRKNELHGTCSAPLNLTIQTGDSLALPLSTAKFWSFQPVSFSHSDLDSVELDVHNQKQARTVYLEVKGNGPDVFHFMITRIIRIVPLDLSSTCYGLNCVPSENSCVEVLIHNVMVF